MSLKHKKGELIQLFEFHCYECEYLQQMRGDCHLCGGPTEQTTLFNRRVYMSHVSHAPNRTELNRTEMNGGDHGSHKK